MDTTQARTQHSLDFVTPQKPRYRRTFMKLKDLWITFLILAAGAASAAEKPDVVFIIVDDLNDWVGVMGGHPQTQTPNIDALASQGVLFTIAHCNAPQCGPSRKSLLGGLYPKSTGRYFNSTKRPAFFGDQPMSGITSKHRRITILISASTLCSKAIVWSRVVKSVMAERKKSLMDTSRGRKT